MKLLHKTSIINIILTSTLLLFGGGVLYLLLTISIKNEVDEKLNVNKMHIIRSIKSGKMVQSIPPLIEVQIIEGNVDKKITLKNVELFDSVENDIEPFRELCAIVEINNLSYQIIVRQVIQEPHDYLNNIGIALSLIWILLLIGFYAINRIIAGKVWEPFYRSLKILKEFKVEQNQAPELMTSGITEFCELNTAIVELTEKVRSDYHSIKEFSENAAHELQTPLAVIHAKLEEAIQDPNLSEYQASRINASLSAIRRLSELNAALLILAKIENRQYSSIKEIDLINETELVLDHYHDFIQAKNITIEKYFVECKLNANPILIETLLNNLIDNAIKYNLEEGKIKIEINSNTLIVSNPSGDTVDDTNELFNRFKKAKQSSNSSGLGLSIVRKICDTLSWDVSYQIDDKWHILKICF